MSITNKLKKNIKNFGKTFLIPKGYVQDSTWSFERHLDGFSHGISFVNGIGGHAGQFTVDVFWRFRHSPFNSDGVMDYSQRIGFFLQEKMNGIELKI